MSILSSTSTGKNSVLNIYFFDKLGMIKCSGERTFYRNQNEYFQGLYTLGAVFIYKNDENEFFYMGRKSTRGLKVKILSRNHLLEMVKTYMEYEEQRLSEEELDSSSYILECYKKIYHNIKELI